MYTYINVHVLQKRLLFTNPTTKKANIPHSAEDSSFVIDICYLSYFDLPVYVAPKVSKFY